MNDEDGPSGTTDFGFREVSPGEKPRLVRGVFDSVASRYDLMNDVMSLGVHRLWKRFAAELSAVRPGQHVLDVAAGTGDLTALLARRTGSGGKVVVTDINASMLRLGRERLTNQGVAGNIEYIQADAERLPFCDNAFDCVTIAFGLRNVTHKEEALASMYRVLRAGGRLLVLEFSKPVIPGLGPVYDLYSFNLLPLMGRIIVNDSESYRYLAESIRRHPDQQSLLEMMQSVGFERCDYLNLSGGIVALHRGYKL